MRKEDIKEIKNRLLERLMTYTYVNIESGILFVKNTYRFYKFLEYRKHMKRTEAFFERGRLYQFNSKESMPLYSKEDIERYTKNVENGNIETLQTIPYFTHFILSRTDDVFMIVKITRIRFDYVILHVLIEDRVCGLILNDKAAMYPWTMFKEL